MLYRLAEIFFTMPTVLIGRNKSYLPNRYSYLPNIIVKILVLNYSLKSIILPSTFWTWLKKLTLLIKGEKHYNITTFFEVYLQKNAFSNTT